MIVCARAVSVLAVLVFPLATTAFCPPDAALWTDVANPDGSRVVPCVGYDPASGLLKIETRGLNGVSDTDDGNLIGGDDVGLISIVIDQAPEPDSFLLTGLRGTNGAGTNWTATFFNGKSQFFAATVVDQYLLPIGTTALAQFQPGLTGSDFGGVSGSSVGAANAVEIGVNFSTGSPGATIFGTIQFVDFPEDFCDFDGDDDCDINDLNMLLQEGPVARGVTVTPGVNDQFDITLDGIINNEDVDDWLGWAAFSNGVYSYHRGDANLDGGVDVSDFNLWNGQKFTFSLAWDDGDFNGDGAVDVSDFNVWKDHKFASPFSVNIVPEPALTGMTFAWVLVVLARAPISVIPSIQEKRDELHK